MGTKNLSLLCCLLGLICCQQALAQNPMPSLNMLYPEAYKGVDRRRKQVRKSEDPWYGLNRQKQCPISGRKFLGRYEHYVDYKGYRVYLSDKRLKWIFNKFPRRSIRRLYDWGERPEKLNLCERCGEIKKSDKCCRRTLETKVCPLCPKHYRSPGCCVPHGYILEVPPPKVRR